MKINSFDSILKLFNSSYLYTVNELKSFEEKSGIQIIINALIDDTDIVYYPQFDSDVRTESESMGFHYAIFYCLERSIRKLIAEAIAGIDGNNWWNSSRIPQTIYDEVEKRIKREIDSGFSRRSENNIDYTTFGELGEIIKHNWTIFGSIFNSQRAVEKVMFNLNMLRNNIAHCCLLSEDEIVRLRLSVKDWFRLME